MSACAAATCDAAMREPRGRHDCPSCSQPVLTVWISGRPVVLDWPHAVNGEYAIEHLVTGSFTGRHAPVGTPLSAVEKRFRAHSCGEPVPSITEPLRAAS